MKTGRNAVNPTRQDPAAGKSTAVGIREGFTLLEVLIALVVLAVGAAFTMSALSGSLGNVRKVQLRTRIMDYAQTAMESALYREDLQQPATITEDLEDGFRYTVHVEEYQSEAGLKPQTGTELPVKLLQYTIEMTGPDLTVPVYQLQTLKIVNSSQAQQSTGTP
jgi:prepilin-type N-terminal cleavage/methylation domain-containing protein